MARGQKHNRPRERSNERAGDIDSRSASGCKVTEGRARDRGAGGAQCKVQHDVLASALEDAEGYVTGCKSEKDEDND